jgi:hypothetical protein
MSRPGPARTPGMGFLRSIESGIERVVDGTVGRVVRVSVQPVEIARKLAKELEDGKTESDGRTFVPSQYTVFLPPKDRERFSEFEASLRVELGAYLAEHVRREGYTVLARPRVTFETADELATGTFGIATERETPPEAPIRQTVPVEAVPVPPIALPDPPLPVQEALPELLEPPVAEPAIEPEPEPEPELLPQLAAELAAPSIDDNPDAPEDGPSLPVVDVPGINVPLPPIAPHVVSAPVPAPAPFLPVPSLPDPLPPLPAAAPETPAAAPEPLPGIASMPVAITESVSAADAARAGLAHTADALVIDGHRHTLTGAVTVIGRSSACDVPLDDASASRRHAELRRRGGKTVLVDLDSTNGTLVNGRRVREAPLRAGDRITIGTTTIVFERAS